MKAFVTGGTGFIGSHLVDTLIEEETYAEVRCLVRNNEKWLKGNDYTKVPGDLHDIPALKNALVGVDVVFHAAGLVKAPEWQQYERANVEATEHLLRVAQKQGVKKIVVLSSLAAAGPSPDHGGPVTEEDPMRPVSMYGRSKKQMEELIHKIATGDQSITILRPSAVYGPREDQIYSFFKMADKRICPIIGDGNSPRISMVYVMDVVQGMLKAAQQNETGVYTYFISGRKLHTWNEIRETTTKVLGKKVIPIYIKPSVVKKVAGAIEKAASFFGVYPVINREKANEMVLEWTCSIEKAERELGYHPEYTLGEGIARTIHWYKRHHWL
ncbi:MAG: NAD-dependent epimerase/dehydratase family protein [Balneolaceae bacterium]|nr:NAD-dependent epimerase/dehydratase family protein [Balneolaceae bacterium]